MGIEALLHLALFRPGAWRVASPLPKMGVGPSHFPPVVFATLLQILLKRILNRPRVLGGAASSILDGGGGQALQEGPSDTVSGKRIIGRGGITHCDPTRAAGRRRPPGSRSPDAHVSVPSEPVGASDRLGCPLESLQPEGGSRKARSGEN